MTTQDHQETLTTAEVTELRAAVEEALALVVGPGNGTWNRSRPIEEWRRLYHLFSRALLSAGDKAEAPRTITNIEDEITGPES